MQIFVKSLSNGEHSLNVAPTTTIGGVKQLLNQKINVAACAQNLILNNCLLEDSRTLAFYNVAEQGTIYQTIKLLGGGKKRKKKNYTTPKKIKHVKKKVKLPVLKYYKVDDDGKITRLRRECPGADCGAGVFMAWHHDRQYCGRCGLTFVFNKEGEQA